YLIESVRLCGYEPAAAECVGELVASWKKEEYEHDRVDALARVTALCDAGDADACSVLPGHEIAYRTLCDAHDYNACAAAACLGDDAADRLAKAHGANANCTAVANREAARTAPPPPRLPKLVPEPALPATPPA